MNQRSVIVCILCSKGKGEEKKERGQTYMYNPVSHFPQKKNYPQPHTCWCFYFIIHFFYFIYAKGWLLVKEVNIERATFPAF